MSEEKKEEKKRENTRVEFHTRAELRGGSTVISGRVENLSLKGMYLIPDVEDVPFEEGEELHITIRLAGIASQLSIELSGTLVRGERGGVGLRFTDMEFDTFLHLRNIVAYNTGDEDRIMEEFSESFDGDI